ncbi:hypothetical protein FHW84_001811 [Dyella sp. SG562]|nr:hypothetical protein [Dyella sp. SG562]NII73242.1 hypothetical protein [Dyella sp. SG562]
MITCETCRHYRRDPVNPPAGLGSCAKQHLPRYPAQKHHCRDHEKP